MKKLVMLAAMLALVLAVAAPAIAQSVNQGLAERNISGNVTDTGTVTSKGNNGSQCVTPLQFGNTGSQQNVQGVQQYASASGDIDPTGSIGSPSGFTFAPELTAPCTQAVQQSSAASSGGG